MSQERNDDLCQGPDAHEEIVGGADPYASYLGAGGDTTISVVAIDRLVRGPLVRVDGENHAHARLLAATPQPLPPILVHRSSMTVLDGMHRMLAAQLRGDTTIEVRFFDGGDDDAYVVAVRANIAHGMPLSLADREQAAQRIVAMHPEWSDRVIGETCGVAPKTVAVIRRRATGEDRQLPTRTGRDGRSRPLDPAPGRRRIAAALADHPGASLRRIAELTGTSVNTVRDVRRRLADNKSPIPDHLRIVKAPEGPTSENAAGRLVDDAAFFSSDECGRFARWFDTADVHPEDCMEFVYLLPLSRMYLIISEAHRRATVWAQFAAALECRARQGPPPRNDG